jgi:hypothetical protein
MLTGNFNRVFEQLLVKAACHRIVWQRFVPVRKEGQESLWETDELRAVRCRPVNQVAGDLGRTVKINERGLRLNSSQSNLRKSEATVGFQSYMLPIGKIHGDNVSSLIIAKSPPIPFLRRRIWLRRGFREAAASIVDIPGSPWEDLTTLTILYLYEMGSARVS